MLEETENATAKSMQSGSLLSARTHHFSNAMKIMRSHNSILFVLLVCLFSSCSYFHAHKTITWNLDDTNLIGGYKTTILGEPQVVKSETNTSIYFNGKDDGVVVPYIPIEGWKKFTIEVLFNPSSAGPVEPRFVHFEDSLQNRGTLEVRITPGKSWYLDAFLKNGATGEGFALIDSTRLHPTDQWYWVAMVYDGKTMKSFVNGQQELEHRFIFPTPAGGNLSLGVRLNKVNWFQGKISELRFHNAVLSGRQLQRL